MAKIRKKLKFFSTEKSVHKIRKIYGKWMARMSHTAMLFTLIMVGISTSITIQDKLIQNGYKTHLISVMILMTITAIITAYTIDRMGLIDAYQEEMWMKNKYTRELNGKRK